MKEIRDCCTTCDPYLSLVLGAFQSGADLAAGARPGGSSGGDKPHVENVFKSRAVSCGAGIAGLAIAVGKDVAYGLAVAAAVDAGAPVLLALGSVAALSAVSPQTIFSAATESALTRWTVKRSVNALGGAALGYGAGSGYGLKDFLVGFVPGARSVAAVKSLAQGCREK